MNIAIDAMGGDYAPQAVLEGVKAALPRMQGNTNLTLYGDEARIRTLMDELGVSDPRVSVVATTEIIGCDESPTMAIRRKKDSSMVRAIADTAAGAADCVLSAGSTGALLTGGTLIIKRIEGVKRPALATVLPAKTGCVLLLDCGANTDCKSEYLEQFAILGNAYMRAVMGIESPRVGLLSNGAEAEKGNALIKETHALLEKAPITFVGNCEARDALGGAFDVVVCDGFDGNVLLKGTEGAVGLMMDLMKESFLSSVRGKLGALLLKPALRSVKKKLDYTEYGGAPLLGVTRGVVKAHGSSNAKAFCSAILQCEKLVSSDVTGVMTREIAAFPSNVIAPSAG